MVFQLAAQRLFDRATRLLHREGRKLVLQMAQVARELRSNEIGACRQKLAQFDVTRSKRGKCVCDPPFARLSRLKWRRDYANGPSRRVRQFQRQRCLRARWNKTNAVLRQHKASASQAKKVRQRACHFRSGLNPPAGVNGSDAAGEISPGYLLEASLADHVGERLLRWKLADALVKIAIGLRTRANVLTYARNDLDG